jgi:hypothetical protein
MDGMEAVSGPAPAGARHEAQSNQAVICVDPIHLRLTGCYGTDQQI